MHYLSAIVEDISGPNYKAFMYVCISNMFVNYTNILHIEMTQRNNVLILINLIIFFTNPFFVMSHMNLILCISLRYELIVVEITKLLWRNNIFKVRGLKEII